LVRKNPTIAQNYLKKCVNLFALELGMQHLVHVARKLFFKRIARSSCLKRNRSRLQHLEYIHDNQQKLCTGQFERRLQHVPEFLKT
jgi:hypothetical protein